MDQLHWGSDGVLVLLVSAITWFIRSKLKGIDDSIKELTAKILSDNEILSIVNSKYQTRREVDLLIKERDEWRAALLQRMAATEAEVIRARDHIHQMANRLTKIQSRGQSES